MIDYYPDGQTVTIEFRDGAYDVPAYFGSLVVGSGIDIHAVTFEEARVLVSSIGLRRHLNGVANRMIVDHQRDHS